MHFKSYEIIWVLGNFNGYLLATIKHWFDTSFCVVLDKKHTKIWINICFVLENVYMLSILDWHGKVKWQGKVIIYFKTIEIIWVLGYASIKH